MTADGPPGNQGQLPPQFPPPYPPPGYPPGYGPPEYMPPPGYYAPPMPPRTSGWAIASLVSSVAGICTLGLGAILGVIFGHIALAEIGRSHGNVEGRGVALAGLIVGYALIALYLAALIFSIVWLSARPVAGPYPGY